MATSTPLTRLRNILQSEYAVRLDSSGPTVRCVEERIAARQAKFRASGKPAPLCKHPIAVAAVASRTSVGVRAIDLLRKIGELTTPSWVNMAGLSASWATRRYFWAIAEPASTRPRLRLDDEVAELDFHQKTLLSDEFGIGMAGLLLERLFGASNAVDVSVALRDANLYQNVRAKAAAQPDYLMWSSRATDPYYVVECKGSQTSRSTTYGQLRRGLEQVPSLIFAAGPRPVNTLVVATLIRQSGTTVYVLDPPPGDDEPFEREDKRTWRITDPDRVVDRMWKAQQLRTLVWAGQFESATRVSTELEFRGRRQTPAVDQELDHRVLQGQRFLGRAVPIFGELAEGRLRIFEGVHEDLLELARHDSSRYRNAASHLEGTLGEMTTADVAHPEEPTLSIGSNGLVLRIEGL